MALLSIPCIHEVEKSLLEIQNKSKRAGAMFQGSKIRYCKPQQDDVKILTFTESVRENHDDF